MVSNDTACVVRVYIFTCQDNQHAWMQAYMHAGLLWRGRISPYIASRRVMIYLDEAGSTNRESVRDNCDIAWYRLSWSWHSRLVQLGTRIEQLLKYSIKISGCAPRNQARDEEDCFTVVIITAQSTSPRSSLGSHIDQTILSTIERYCVLCEGACRTRELVEHALWNLALSVLKWKQKLRCKP